MSNLKAKQMTLINCLIILLIIYFLNNSYAASFNFEDSERFQSSESTTLSHPDHYDFLDTQNIESFNFEEHEPINIDGNNDFVNQAASEEWPGDGSEGNPIVIDGLKLTGEKCFIITNTDLFFNLSNCMITCPEEDPNYVPTLFFANISNGIIFNNILAGGGESVLQISSSDSVTINNNSITNSVGGTGIEILGSTNINIFDNIVSDNDLIGIHFAWGSSNNLITRNRIHNNGYVGIHLIGETDNNEIITNDISNNADYGVFTESTTGNNQIKWNNFLDNHLSGPSHACDDGSNNVFTSNYWNDWTNPDSDTDGIVDNPYLISGSAKNKDNFPVTCPHSLLASHPDHYSFLEAWDTGPGQDVVIDGLGNVYKTDQAGGVDIYDSKGNYDTTWTGGGVLHGTCGLIFDSQWNLYIVNEVIHQVVKLDSQGNFVLSWGSEGEDEGQFTQPNRIACDSQDNIFVADNGVNRIQKFDSDGTFIRSWNIPEGGMVGLAVDSQDFVYVASEHIFKYDVDGNPIKEWGTPLTGDGCLSSHGLAVDSFDALYVTEIGTPRVQKFDSNGVFITDFGSDGGKGQLNHPLGIAVAANGLVYVIDAGNERIQIYTPQTIPTTIIRTESTTSTEYATSKPIPKQDLPSLINTIILPTPIALVLFGLLILMNRLIGKIEEVERDKRKKQPSRIKAKNLILFDFI